ncbi:MAG: DUF805 domain-containing protein [SAR86 cluster bacterium]|uniref:DUF805 domain-containing protein n=1 Tax=SAR86 cluster bacterium TaxID=2030880 RepID=A0A368BW79_9GAMM|nr:MAG: DUF805 domain-containing protein [SAR86 cluster bacterium]
MNFTDAVKAYFLKWNDFRSRSSRSEYWWATLFVTLASFPVGFIIGFVIGILFLTAGFSETTMEIVVGIVMLPIQIFIIIASTCLVIRRLHDVDKSGWWYLIIFTIIGIIPLLIWYCSKGTDGENRFGKDPLEQLQ